MVLQVLGEIDRGHPTRAEFPLDGVALNERATKGVDGVQCYSPGEGMR